MKLLKMIGKVDVWQEHEPKTRADMAAALLEGDPSVDSFFPGLLTSPVFNRIAEACSFSEVQTCVSAMGWIKAGWKKIPQIAHNKATHRQDIKRSEVLREQAYELLREAARSEGLINENFFLPDEIRVCRHKPSEPITAGNLNERWDSLSDYQKDWLTHTCNKTVPKKATGFEEVYNKYFSKLGGASKENGAVKGASVRYMDVFLSPCIKTGRTGKRYATIAALLKFADINITPDYVRSTLERKGD